MSQGVGYMFTAGNGGKAAASWKFTANLVMSILN
jgi:hypothetical protein